MKNPDGTSSFASSYIEQEKTILGRLAVLFLALIGAVHAADITGTWSGSMAMTKGEETKDDSAYLVLKQTGNEITGTIGPNPDKRLNITKGSAEGNNIYIEAIVEGENRLVLRLRIEGEKLVGDLKAEGPTAPPISGKMSLTREKQP
jgi:hypothetical protein